MSGDYADLRALAEAERLRRRAVGGQYTRAAVVRAQKERDAARAVIARVRAALRERETWWDELADDPNLDDHDRSVIRAARGVIEHLRHALATPDDPADGRHGE